MCNKCNHTNKCCSEDSGGGNRKWVYAALSALLLVVGMVLQYTSEWFEESWVRAALFAVAYLPVGLPVLKEAWEGICNRDFFNEFSLMSIASIGAFCIGEYPEAVAVMLFYSIGETLQDGAVERAKGNINALLDVRPETAAVVEGDKIETKHPSEVKPGDVIEVKVGERLPLDGVLIDGKASFNTAALTGESMPRTVEDGGEVLAGMIAADRTVKVSVTKVFAESALSRILKLVEEASDRKAPAELFIRKFARIYTPTVIVLAFLIMAILSTLSYFGIVGMSYSDAFYRGLVFLVVSCPCALVVSIPLSYFAGIGAASRRGILFKGGNYLSEITKVNMVVFDKTGTLTTGQFKVKSIDIADGVAEEQLLSIASSVEAMSNHPIAKAVVEFCNGRGVAPCMQVDSVEENAGYGVKASVDGRIVLLGNMKLLKKEGITNLPDFSASTATVVGCAVDSAYFGALLLADEAKADAREAISGLAAEGIKETMILSGDKSAIVAELAKELGVTGYAGDLLPADKVERFQRLKGNGKVLAFVGDGINDAPVLALSDVGIAMGGLGSDAAIETADVVIQNDSPAKVAEAVRIGRITKSIVGQNIVMAIGVKIVVMVLGTLGIAGLWEAVFADVGVALIAVLNALRIQWLVTKNH